MADQSPLPPGSGEPCPVCNGSGRIRVQERCAYYECWAPVAKHASGTRFFNGHYYHDVCLTVFRTGKTVRQLLAELPI